LMKASRIAAPASLLILFGGLPVGPAFASHCGDGAGDEACIDGADDGFTIIDQADDRGVQGRNIGLDGRVRGASTLRRQTVLVPTCDGNSAENDLGVCTAAVATCPTPGDTRFWLFTRVVDTNNRTLDPPYIRRLDPDSVCLGPDDPRIAPTVAIPALIDRDFQRVVVLKGVAEVSPAPDTLVNIETRFSTSAPASYEIPLTVLGQTVVITATAVSWTWHFGDGTTERVTTGGGSTVHEYQRSGARAAYVVIEWTGTYRIGADQTVRPVNGTATTTGQPVQIAVKTARTELVDQSG